MELNKIYNMDCLEGMKQIEDKSVDMVLCDLPYGVTKNKADIVLPFDKLWGAYKRILKPAGNIVLTAQFPFTIDLINSNRSWFKYDIIWNKKLISGFLNAKRQPLRVHEHILIFYDKLGTYNPQFTIGEKSHSKGNMKSDVNQNYGKYGKVDNCEIQGTKKFPKSIISIQKSHPSKAHHRTEKPVDLAEWLIKTYSTEGDIILDNCIGTGWTAIACKELNRKFIGFEINNEYCEIAEERLKQKTPLNSVNEQLED